MFISILLTILIIALFLAAFVFTVFPIIWGVLFSLAGTLIYVIWKGIGALGVLNFWLIIGLSALYLIFDFLAGYYGTKKFGASIWGFLGSILGGIFGTMVLGLIGLVIGPIIGATLLEFLFNKNIKQSFRSGLGALFGVFVGTFGKLIILTIIVGTFILGIMQH
jgi:hypothetical protein